MEKKVLYDSHMDFEHQHWKGEIAFWKGELKSFNKRLSELITRWENKEVLDQIGYYQNQFVFHEDTIDDMLEIIEQHEMHISTKDKAGTDALDTKFSKRHIEFRNQIETERELYTELKKNFFRFLEKYL